MPVSEDFLTYTHTQPTVGTSSAQVLAQNTNRQYALFINDSAVVVYLNIGGVAVVNQGIRLNANGGSFEMSQGTDNLSSVVVNAIAVSGTGSVILVSEAV